MVLWLKIFLCSGRQRQRKAVLKHAQRCSNMLKHAQTCQRQCKAVLKHAHHQYVSLHETRISTSLAFLLHLQRLFFLLNNITPTQTFLITPTETIY